MLTAVTERLMDVDERVRSSAISAICDAAVRDLQVCLLARHRLLGVLSASKEFVL